jgi:hypothetical protein
MWSGTSFGNWIGLLSLHSFGVASKRMLVQTSATTVISVLNSIGGWLERVVYGAGVNRTELVAPPVFIVGHWRTGTTHLHNLLALDERFTYPTTYTCMFPHHFLLSERMVKRLVTLPETRPMDNMRIWWDSPQEDELALSLLSGFSLYWDWAFPDRLGVNQRFLDFRDASVEERECFKKLLVSFVRRLTFRCRKRLVLKSPAHTYRVGLLAEIFPGAKFIHIYRDPVRVFLSSVHAFSVIRRMIGLTKPDDSGLEEQVLESMLLCYQRWREDRQRLAADQFFEVRFEDLEREPLKELERVYTALDLGDFDEVKSRMRSYLASISGYKKNRYEIPPKKRREVAVKLVPIMETYGYEC